MKRRFAHRYNRHMSRSWRHRLFVGVAVVAAVALGYCSRRATLAARPRSQPPTQGTERRVERDIEHIGARIEASRRRVRELERRVEESERRVAESEQRNAALERSNEAALRRLGID